MMIWLLTKILLKTSKTTNLRRLFEAARPYESCKIFKGRPRRNAFSKLVHRAANTNHFLLADFFQLYQKHNWVEE